MPNRKGGGSQWRLRRVRYPRISVKNKSGSMACWTAADQVAPRSAPHYGRRHAPRCSRKNKKSAHSGPMAGGSPRRPYPSSCTNTCTHTRTHTYTHARTRARAHTHTHTHNTHAHTHARARARAHTHTQGRAGAVSAVHIFGENMRLMLQFQALRCFPFAYPEFCSTLHTDTHTQTDRQTHTHTHKRTPTRESWSKV